MRTEITVTHKGVTIHETHGPLTIENRKAILQSMFAQIDECVSNSEKGMAKPYVVTTIDELRSELEKTDVAMGAIIPLVNHDPMYKL